MTRREQRSSLRFSLIASIRKLRHLSTRLKRIDLDQMDEANSIAASNWVWGAVWVFYALFYGRYFQHVASRVEPGPKQAQLQGSAERLLAKGLWCRRFAFFMGAVTIMEFLRSTDFTHGMITLGPLAFGFWVMRSIWKEVFRSKLPKPQTDLHRGK